MKKENIYVTLNNRVKLQISEEAQEMVSKLRKEVLKKDMPTDMVTFLINEIFKQYTTFKAQEWFANKTHLKDLEMHQDEMQRLEKTIETMKMKIT